MSRRWIGLSAGLLLAVGASGCASQISALAPVGGDGIYKVRVAAIDVLMEQGIAIKAAPVCAQETAAVVCAGTTMDGEDISVNAPGTGKATMTVSVGGTPIFDGTVQDVIDKGAGIE